SAVALDLGPRERAPLRLVLGVNAERALEVIAVELAQELHRDLALFGEQLRVELPHRDRARGLERVIEADAVDVLHLLEPRLALLVRDRELFVGGEQLFTARVELEIDGVDAELGDERLVVALALLEAGGDERDGA